MLLNLNLPPGDSQREFLDYLNSALRARLTAFTGSSGRRDDGRFESTVSGAFNLGTSSIPITWRLVRAADDGTVETLDAVGGEGAPPESEWQVPALEFVNSVLSATIAARRSTFFCRGMFCYVGEHLDGEYWLPGFRFAPALPDDEQPFLLNAERVVVFDMNVVALDQHHASALADEAARRHAARLSLLLNHGLYRPDQSMRWILPQEGDSIASESRRQHLAFSSARAVAAAMPEKGEICPLGKYEGSLTARYRYAGTLLSLPREARRILRSVDSAAPELRLAFDRGARLYQVGAIIGRQFPTAGLAYRVAALDTLSQANGSKKVLIEFVRKYASPSPDNDTLVDYLWGSIRSAHFHGGEFPLGEFSTVRFFEPLMDSVETTQDQLHRFCYELTREVIVRWLYDQLATAVSGEVADDAQGDTDA